MKFAACVGILEMATKTIKKLVKGHRRVLADPARQNFTVAGGEAPHEHPRVHHRRDAQKMEVLERVPVLGELVLAGQCAIKGWQWVQLAELVQHLGIHQGLGGHNLDH